MSIQGEGMLVGTPSTFIRVAGCNLRCAWCDSPKTSWTVERTSIGLEQLTAICAAGPRHVVLTGGEPLLFPAIARLAADLRRAGHHVTVETAGTVWLDGLECDLLSLSPKLAHSTPWKRAPDLAQRHEDARIDVENLRRLMDGHPWQLKPVVRAHDPAGLARDLAETLELVARLGVEEPARVMLMPECTDPARLSSDYQNLVPALREHGFSLGQRLHIQLFGHTPGT